ncbi:putative lipoprotein [Leptospira kmetyi serovar Malaysia str. Bejo-Iso9]|nr:putative lipoprotein [Leptospira kmetyi serovar Malaysia str. Bejo-Iso9]
MRRSILSKIGIGILLVSALVPMILIGCKTPESKGAASSIETPRYLRLNYDVVYDTSEGVTLHDSGKLFARGLFYDFTINSSANQFERIKASSYTEDNQIDFKHILTANELSSLKNRQYQYFSMPNDSRASVLTGIHNERCYIRWEWQKESFIFVFETDAKIDSGKSPAALGKEFHENIRKGLRIF